MANAEGETPEFMEGSNPILFKAGDTIFLKITKGQSLTPAEIITKGGVMAKRMATGNDIDQFHMYCLEGDVQVSFAGAKNTPNTKRGLFKGDYFYSPKIS